MERWAIEIEFKDKRYCLHCPLRDIVDDTCRLQEDSEGYGTQYESWEKQIENCPLQPV
jgi:hypothetical protein